MNYVLTPTDDDILHYKKGSESKKHNYISRVFKKGRWVYTYAKNRARGNKVTNQTKGTTPYSPNEGKTTVTNQTPGVTQYNPNVKTYEQTSLKIDRKDLVANKHTFKVMTQVMDPTVQSNGLAAFDNIIQSRKKESVTNAGYAPGTLEPRDYQYTPNYKTPDSSKHYTPDIRTNMPVNPSLKTPLSYTQTSADPIKYDRLIRRDLGQKSLAEQYAEQEKKKKNKKK